MMTTSALRRRAKEARLWLFESCFPLWAEHGLTDAGLFPEVLSLQHDEVARDVTRVRLQARQTYLFAEAWRMGWRRDTAARLVQSGVSILTGPALAASGLPGKTLHADGRGLADASADLYDTAFVLFALAEAANGPGPARNPRNAGACRWSRPGRSARSSAGPGPATPPWRCGLSIPRGAGRSASRTPG